MEVCLKCGIEKPLSRYGKTYNGIDLRRNICKDCCNIYKKKYRDLESSKVKAQATKRKNIIDNHEKWLKRWERDRNIYNARLKQATLKPFNAYAVVRSLYPLCRQLSKKNGVKYSVDHIIPLAGENVSGLNVPWNIQVIPLSQNCKKYNQLQEVGYQR